MQKLISYPIFIFPVKEHHSQKTSTSSSQQVQVFSQLVLPMYEGVRAFEQVRSCEHFLKVFSKRKNTMIVKDEVL
jgi:hypothetical protein